MNMKRSLIAVVTLALLLGACASVTSPGTTGVVTEVSGNTFTVAVGGTPTTYNITNRTLIYSPDGGEAVRAYLSKGQRVMVWADGSSNAIRINIEG